MLSRCKVLLCCMCLTAALTLASGQIRGAEFALFCPLGSTAAATGATCMPAECGCCRIEPPSKAFRTMNLHRDMHGHTPDTSNTGPQKGFSLQPMQRSPCAV